MRVHDKQPASGRVVRRNELLVVPGSVSRQPHQLGDLFLRRLGDEASGRVGAGEQNDHGGVWVDFQPVHNTIDFVVVVLSRDRVLVPNAEFKLRFLQ